MSGIIQSLIGSVSTTVKDTFFNLVCFLLNTSSTTGLQNNTFQDSSQNNYTVTRNPASGPNAPTQGTFSPFSPTGWSNYFGGVSDGLRITGATANYLGSGDFTFETWIYVNNITTLQTVLSYGTTGSVFRVFVNNATIWLLAGGTNITLPGGASVVTANQWMHLAVVRSGSATNNIKVYINGVGGTLQGTSTTNFNTGTLYIGLENGTNPFSGYMSNYRIIKGQALTSGNFTPPTGPVNAVSVGWTGANVAGSITGTVPLVTCQSNRFVDNSSNGYTFIVTGTPFVQAFSPFVPNIPYSTSAGGSGYFDGSGDYLTVADATPLRFVTGEFTINCWIYRNAAGAIHTIASKGSNTGPTGWSFQVTAANVLQFTYTSTNLTSSITIPAGSWTYVTVVRFSSGPTFALYVNGVFSNNAITSTIDFSQTNNLNIGTDRNTTNNFNGYIAGFEYIKGTAVIPSGLPTAPPTISNNPSLLLNFTNAAIYDAATKTNIETVGTAQTSTTQFNFSPTSVFINGAGNYLFMPITPATRFGSANWTIEFFFRPTSVSVRQIILSWNAISTASAYAACNVNLLSTGELDLQISESGSSWQYDVTTAPGGFPPALTANTWYYVAVTRSGDTITLYLNGSSIGTVTLSSATASLMTAATAVRNVIGISPDLTNQPFTGYIDEVRVTNGVARTITSTPTAAFPVQ